MEISNVAVFVLLAAIVFLLGIRAIPTLIFMIHPDFMSYQFDNPGADGELALKSDALQDWIRRLRELDFFLMGIKSEKLPLWGSAYREATLVSREAESYASIVMEKDGSPLSLYFYTPLRGGGMVFTRNHQTAPEAEGERLSVKSIVSEDFQKILDGHVQRVRSFQDKGWMPAVGSTPEARIEATRAFYASPYARGRIQFLFTPSVMSFLLSLILLAAVFVYTIAAR